MKARLPQGYGGGGAANIQQLARQAQKIQEEMDAASAELDQKLYTATSGGDAVKATVSGSLEVQSIEIKPEVVDPEDVEMLADLVRAAVNEALRAASEEKAEKMEKISGGFGMFVTQGFFELFEVLLSYFSNTLSFVRVGASQ